MKQDKADVAMQVIGRAVDTHGNDALKKTWEKQVNIWADDKPDPLPYDAYARANSDGRGFTLFASAYSGGPSRWGTTNLFDTISHEVHHSVHPYWYNWQMVKGGVDYYDTLHDQIDAASKVFLKEAGIQ